MVQIERNSITVRGINKVARRIVTIDMLNQHLVAAIPAIERMLVRIGNSVPGVSGTLKFYVTNSPPSSSRSAIILCFIDPQNTIGGGARSGGHDFDATV